MLPVYALQAITISDIGVLWKIGAGVIAGVPSAWYAGKKLYSGSRRVSNALNRIELISTQFENNGGGSLRDAVDRIEINQALNGALTRSLASAARDAVFVTDSAGSTTWVNERWLELTGLTLPEALGNGWVTAVHQQDREWVVNEWHEAVEDKRLFINSYRYQHVKTGEVTQLTCRAEPVLSGKCVVAGWIGVMRLGSKALPPVLTPLSVEHTPPSPVDP